MIPKPMRVSPVDSPDSINSRYFTPHRGYALHAMTGVIGMLSAFAPPATVASAIAERALGRHTLVLLHP